MSTHPGEGSLEESLGEMTRRLEALQDPLSQLVDLGLYLHRSIRPTAPRGQDRAKDSPSFYVASSNTYNGLPVSDTLTLSIGADKGIDSEFMEIAIYNGPSPTQPIWMFDHWSLYSANSWRLTRVQVFHEQSGALFPLDVETSLFHASNSRHLGFLGMGYEGQEPYIDIMENQMLSLLIESSVE